jgi:D-alanyl-D-alanine carboxypeptidase
MATLGRALQDRFPQYYGYFATPEFEWAGVTYRNHNNLLGEVEGVDGIKTGYTSASGYNLVTSVKRDGRYLVAVVMGGNTSTSRDDHMRDLITTYLPRASAGPRTAPLVVANPLDLNPVPLPRFNPIRTDPIMTAAVTVPPPVSPVPVAQGDFDPFVIQIGAFPSEQAAVMQLERAQQLAAQVVAGAAPYTETVNVNGVLHYRARFIGFTSVDAARAACAAFEAQGIDCFVP